MIIHATVVRACLEAAIAHSETGAFGAAFPDELYTNAGKYTGAASYNLMVRHLHDIAGGAVVTAPVDRRPREPRGRATWRASTCRR